MKWTKHSLGILLIGLAVYSISLIVLVATHDLMRQRADIGYKYLEEENFEQKAEIAYWKSQANEATYLLTEIIFRQPIANGTLESYNIWKASIYKPYEKGEDDAGSNHLRKEAHQIVGL